MSDNGSTQRQLIWAVVVLFCAALASVVLLQLVHADTATVTAVLASLAPTVAVLAAMRQTAAVDDKVRAVQADTHALTNGLLDSKVRAGVAEVLPDELVDPEYHSGQHEADRVAAEAAHNGDHYHEDRHQGGPS